MPSRSGRDERMYEHVEASEEERGVGEERAEEIAERTVNKKRREEGRTPAAPRRARATRANRWTSAPAASSATSPGRWRSKGAAAWTGKNWSARSARTADLDASPCWRGGGSRSPVAAPFFDPQHV